VEWVKVGKSRIPTIHAIAHGGKPFTLKWNGRKFAAHDDASGAKAQQNSWQVSGSYVSDVVVNTVTAPFFGRTGHERPQSLLAPRSMARGNMRSTHDGNGLSFDQA